MDGIHFFGEWFDCASTTVEFTSAAALRELCLSATAAVGLTAVGDTFHQFEPQGVTGTVLLAESHLTIHTFPEHGHAAINLYLSLSETNPLRHYANCRFADSQRSGLRER